jgi:glycosyltransferase involved in cell wall biosynthesis
MILFLELINSTLDVWTRNKMRKKRILFCSEATFLNTGYATYTREILNYLHSTMKYEIAEMGAYGQRNDPRAANIPWKYYGVSPNTECEPLSSKEEIDAYNSMGTNQFGEWIFEHVCLDFMPDIVCDIRDFWMLDFAERSPFRNYYNWVVMPTVDARPQARQWIATYNSADAVLTYSDWAGGVLNDQSGGKIKYHGSAPPSAHPAYSPVADKNMHKLRFGIDPKNKIIGTVMRNQRRKLYPDLFEAFRKFLDKAESKDYYLYCHTSYPDLGWDIPELLHQNDLASHVMFTYICPETKKPFPSLFKGAVAQSPYKGKWGATLSNVKNGASYEDLSDIINLFDLYTQYANCEGFGLPQVEAAACGVPVCGTDYSAMESVLRKLEGFTITPAALYKELETGCLRAVPDNEYASEIFLHFFEKMSEEDRAAMGKRTRENFEKYFQWHLSGSKWEQIFDSFETRPLEQTWCSPANIKPVAPKPPEDQTRNADPSSLTKWLIQNVLGDNSKLNTYFESRMIRDLTYRTATHSTGGMYFNESSAAFDGLNVRQPFDFNIAYNQMEMQANKRNAWEEKRVKSMRQKGLMQ